MIKKLLTTILLLSSVFAFTQTRYTSQIIEVDNPQYGLTAQLFNGSQSDIFLDRATIKGFNILPLFVGSDSPDHVSVMLLSIGLSNVEQSNCVPDHNVIALSGIANLTNGVRVSSYPCQSEYILLDFASLETCVSKDCTFDYRAEPIIVHPGTGVTLWVAVYDGKNAFSFVGHAWLSFEWHDHVGCPFQSNNPMCIQ